jgi:glutaredoxin 3
MAKITMYTTSSCPDCWRAKSFMKQRGIEFLEVNIEHDGPAEERVIAANYGKRKVPTFEVSGRYFACSPFNAVELAEELGVPLN